MKIANMRKIFLMQSQNFPTAEITKFIVLDEGIV